MSNVSTANSRDSNAATFSNEPQSPSPDAMSTMVGPRPRSSQYQSMESTRRRNPNSLMVAAEFILHSDHRDSVFELLYQPAALVAAVTSLAERYRPRTHHGASLSAPCGVPEKTNWSMSD